MKIKLTQSLSFFVAGTPISSNVFGPFPGLLVFEGGGLLDVGAVVGLGGVGCVFCGGFGAAGCNEGTGRWFAGWGVGLDVGWS